jgi:hypothetical protein
MECVEFFRRNLRMGRLWEGEVIEAMELIAVAGAESVKEHLSAAAEFSLVIGRGW